MQTEITSDGESVYTDVPCSSTTFLDAVYVTCKESHHLLKSHYKFRFAGRSDFLRPIWFDSDVDILYFSDWIALDNFITPEDWNPRREDPDTKSVKHLALPLPYGIWNRTEGIFAQQKVLTPNHCQVCCFGQLSELTFVSSQAMKDGDLEWFLEKFEREMRATGARRERKGHESRAVEELKVSFVDQSDFQEASHLSQDS